MLRSQSRKAPLPKQGGINPQDDASVAECKARRCRSKGHNPRGDTSVAECLGTPLPKLQQIYSLTFGAAMFIDKDFDEAVDYIGSLGVLGWKPGLERFTALCERLGSPHKKLKAIHIGGTNGKGSTTAMISSILKSAGYRVGTYYSPYVYNIRERVQLDCGIISKDAFARLVNVIRPHAAAIGETDLGHPTEFEVKTALGLLYFVEQGVDFAVLEVGLGGRLDATNIVTPLVSVITNVTLDHMEHLGDTIPKIAGEKAGIIKEGGHLITASQDPEALSVMCKSCAERKSLMRHVHPCGGHLTHYTVSPVVPGQEYRFPVCEAAGNGRHGLLDVDGMRASYTALKIGMRGNFQYANAATAVSAIEALGYKGVDISESSVRAGIESAYLPGRLEVLQQSPTLLIDGAHNQDSAYKLADALKTSFSYKRLILVMGMVKGHSPRDVAGILSPMADVFIATAPDSGRAAPAESVAEVAREHCANVSIVEPVADAVHHALTLAAPDDLVCVTGSFYTISEVPRQSS
jgi:dihydrofolate synthase/folylpolyglutamate synthase